MPSEEKPRGDQIYLNEKEEAALERAEARREANKVEGKDNQTKKLKNGKK